MLPHIPSQKYPTSLHSSLAISSQQSPGKFQWAMMLNVRLLGLFRPCSEVLFSARCQGRKRYYTSRGGEISLTRGALKCRFLWQHGMTFVSPPPPPFSGARTTLLTLRNASNETPALTNPWRTQKNNLNQPGKPQQQWKRLIASVPEQPESETGSSYSDGRGGCCNLTEESSRSISTKGPLKPRDVSNERCWIIGR